MPVQGVRDSIVFQFPSRVADIYRSRSAGFPRPFRFPVFGLAWEWESMCRKKVDRTDSHIISKSRVPKLFNVDTKIVNFYRNVRQDNCIDFKAESQNR